MKWIELREWLGLAPADLPCWAAVILFILCLTTPGGALAASMAAGSIAMAGVGWTIGHNRNPHLGPLYNRVKRWAYPLFLAIIVVGVVYRFTRTPRATEDPVDPQATATLVTSPAHNFSISFPPPYHKPEEEKKTLGLNSLIMWIATGKEGAMAVMVTQYPEEVFKTNTPQGLLGELHFATVTNLQGKIEKQEQFLFDGHPALRSVVDHHERTGQKGYSRFELILVPPRLYTIRTSHSSRDTLERPSMKAFSDSFRLTP
jgi:hypothetical protein